MQCAQTTLIIKENLRFLHHYVHFKNRGSRLFKLPQHRTRLSSNYSRRPWYSFTPDIRVACAAKLPTSLAPIQCAKKSSYSPAIDFRYMNATLTYSWTWSPLCRKHCRFTVCCVNEQDVIFDLRLPALVLSRSYCNLTSKVDWTVQAVWVDLSWVCFCRAGAARCLRTLGEDLASSLCSLRTVKEHDITCSGSPSPVLVVYPSPFPADALLFVISS